MFTSTITDIDFHCPCGAKLRRLKHGDEKCLLYLVFTCGSDFQFRNNNYYALVRNEIVCIESKRLNIGCSLQKRLKYFTTATEEEFLQWIKERAEAYEVSI